MLDNCLDDFRPLFWGENTGFGTVSFHIFDCNPLQISRDTPFAFPLHETMDMCFFNGSFASERDQVVKSPEGFLGKAEVERSGILKQKHVTWLFPCQVFQYTFFFVKNFVFRPKPKAFLLQKCMVVGQKNLGFHKV